MKISGFTFVRNGIKYDYPFIESIKSVLPIVDEMIVNIPLSEDNTLEQIKELAKIEKKIKIIETKWDDKTPSGGTILAHHTNLALQKCTGDWCLYIQADEIIHEKDHTIIQKTMQDNINNKNIDGILFDYIHFYGSYNSIAKSRNWYQKEIRIIRNKQNIISYKDAQGFRHKDLSRITVINSTARIFHYGWVKPIELMREKTVAMDRLWHGNARDKENKKFTYNTTQYGLKEYKGTHPVVMKKRINKAEWTFSYKSSIRSIKDIKSFISDIVEKIFRKRLFEYRGYKIAK